MMVVRDSLNVVVPQVIAHRGNKSVAPENTLAAFAAAVACGAQSIEMDIVRSREGVAMVVHDETLDATTSGSGLVVDFFVDQIQSLDAGSWFSSAFAGAQVPTFEQFAQFMSAYPDVEVLLEFKGDWTIAETEQVVKTIDVCGIREQTILQSFSRVSVASAAAVAPDMRRGVLFISQEALTRLNPITPSTDGVSLAKFEQFVEQCAAIGIYTINPFVQDVFASPRIIEQIQNAGMKAQVWTANSSTQWRDLVELGVDGIITDKPDALLGWFAGTGLRSL